MFRSTVKVGDYRSLSSWRAWIEIHAVLMILRISPRRSPHGERGLKLPCTFERNLAESVALLMESVD